jgi:predicted RNA binding protein YcfA (HicA-like mRNA interferase family)
VRNLVRGDEAGCWLATSILPRASDDKGTTEAPMHPERKKNPRAKRPSVKDKEHDQLIKAAWNAGWWAKYKKGGHVLCLHPTDKTKMVLVTNTPGDHRSVANHRAAFRQNGLDL